jgi:superfamily II DNA/RNA helicase
LAKQKLLDVQLLESLEQHEITDFTELEQVCIPKLKSGHDLLCIAENGSGKTLSIVIGVLQQLKKPQGDNPRAVIVVPDTERALEMKNTFQQLGKYANLRVHTACENEKIDDQKDRIYMGSDVVIGTQKRLTQVYSLYALNLSSVKIVAIDDAEEVIKSSNITQMVRLLNGPTKTQHVVFAGKMTEWIERIADETMNVQEVIEFDEELETE